MLAAYAGLVEAVHAPLMLVGPRGELLAANQVMRRRLAAPGCATVRAAAPAYDEALGGRYDRAASVPVVRRTEGCTVHEMLHIEPFEGGACITVEDCTQLSELKAVNAQTTRLASLGFMVAGICHEVSNPLAAVSSMLQMLQSRRDLAPEAFQKGLASIAANIARVLAITRKLGDFSRVGGEELTPVSVDEAMAEAVMLLRHSAWGGAVKVDYRGMREATVLTRRGQLQQVLFNLLLNAAQAMQGTGRIEAHAGVAGDARIRVAVRDEGPGIAANVLPRVFEPFFTTKGIGEGTGLGLAISGEIARELGGRIWVENDARGGACFTIELPLRQPGAA